MPDYYYCHASQDSSFMYEYHCRFGLNRVLHSLTFRLMFAWRPTVCFKDTVNKMKLGVSHAFLPRTVIQRGPRGMFKPEDLCCVGVAPLSTIRWQRATVTYVRARV